LFVLFFGCKSKGFGIGCTVRVLVSDVVGRRLLQETTSNQSEEVEKLDMLIAGSSQIPLNCWTDSCWKKYLSVTWCQTATDQNLTSGYSFFRTKLGSSGEP